MKNLISIILIIGFTTISLTLVSPRTQHPFFNNVSAHNNSNQKYSCSSVYLPLILSLPTPLCNEANNYCEDNDSNDTAYGPLVIGATYRAYAEDLNDFYYFIVPRLTRIAIEVTNYYSVGQLQLQDERGNLIGFDESNSFGRMYLEDTLDSGFYFVRIATVSSYNTNTQYSLHLTYPATFSETAKKSETCSWVGYDFETGTENWTTSESGCKLASLDTTTETKYSGNQSLELTTELFISEDSCSQHTEATAYFDHAIPIGMDKPGPYDLTGKEVSCFVYLPPGLASQSVQAYIRLFVKDSTFHNQFGQFTGIDSTNIGQWVLLSLKVGEGDGIDPGFNSAQTNTLGIRIELLDNSNLMYTGPIFIDKCTIEYP